MNSGLVLAGLSKTLGGRTIVDGLELRVEPGEMVCLLGPSGCGKTTTLRMAAGFLTPDAGRVEIGGTDYAAVPPERRPTAMVFQNYALWPHMTVAGNVGFGLKMHKVPKAEAARRVAEALDLVGLTHHADSYPARISGGEQQRTALARALALRPQLLLLDEPLSNLDAKLRERVREEIRDIQQRLGITTLFVTHDQDEALSVADRIAVMNAGRIEQYAAPDDLYRTPATLFTAEFVGSLNRLDDVTVGQGEVRLADGTVLLRCAEVVGPAGAGKVVGIRPEEVRLGETLPGETRSGAEGGGSAVVTRVLPRGHFTEVVLRLDTGGVTLRSYLTGVTPGVGERVLVSAGRALAYDVPRGDVLGSDVPEGDVPEGDVPRDDLPKGEAPASYDGHGAAA
ncbi:ABC transporter ATP-binding protein [Streptomyces roseirectus]|uniref:ABC transporter ATP-binding protein n=1 Tax=Streptomyces roseirectus TaxID=2768066 RepID=UPI001FE68A3C|nr:ABC transporter ATP-binding protein [Streptomyces roseirectus]